MTTKIKIGGFSTLFNVIDFMAFRFRLLLGFSLSLLVTLMIYLFTNFCFDVAC